jgi:Holliday junction resolvasome RuvABC endonuclease subunit
MPEWSTSQEVAAAAAKGAGSYTNNVPHRQGRLAPPPRTEHTILAIDLGQHCGWCLRQPDGSLEAGTWELKPKNSTSPMGEAMATLEELLDGAIKHASIVAYEQVRRHEGVDAAHWYGAILGRLLQSCWSHGVKAVPISVQHSKMTATGKGNANKQAMLAAARDRWPTVPIKGDNQADAMWIAETAAELVVTHQDA